MRNLIKGVKSFSENTFPQQKEVFEQLKDGQNPHTLFIGCSDSRIIPNLITKSLPGELFVVRNIANIVPNYRTSQEYLATTSAIEFAVLALNVENIVVCGHSNCGGCKALLTGANLESLPHTKKWLEQAQKVKDLALGKDMPDNQDLYALVEQLNVVEQISHLLSYPFIAEKSKSKKLKIYGWYYDIGTGQVYNYNKRKKVFERIE